jgi:hypothetical protein
MRNFWIGLVLATVFSIALALTRDWWLPGESRETWHRSWLETRPRQVETAASIQAEHERLLAEIEKEYGEKIAREKAIHRKYRSELLRKGKKTP